MNILTEYQLFVRSQNIQIQSSHLSKNGAVGADTGFHMSARIPKGMTHAGADFTFGGFAEKVMELKQKAHR